MPPEKDYGPSINLRAAKGVFFRHMLLCGAIVVIAVLSAGAYTALQKPTYLASASAYVENKTRAVLKNVEIGMPMDRDLASAQKVLARSRPVMERAALKLNLRDKDALNFLESGKYTNVINDGLLLIFNVEHEEPAKARDLANAWMEAFVEEMSDRQRAYPKYVEKFLKKDSPDLRKDWMEKAQALSDFLEKTKFDPNLTDHPIKQSYATISQRVTESKLRLADIQSDIELRDRNDASEFSMTVGNRVFSGKGAREEAAKALTFTILSWRDDQTLQPRGQFRDFEILSKGKSGGLGLLQGDERVPELFIRGRATYSANLNALNPVGTVQSIEHTLRSLDKLAGEQQSRVVRAEKELVDYQSQADRSFEHEERLKQLLG